MMDKFEFINVVSEIFEDCSSESYIEKRRSELVDVINNISNQAKAYLKIGIL